MAKSRMSADQRREELLSAGARLLGERRYAEVSIEEIAAAAGVAKGLLYHYFPSKDDFIVAILERGQQELADRLAPDPSLAAGERFEVSLNAFLDCLEDRPPGLYSMSGRGSASPRIMAVIEVGRAEQLARLAEAVVEWEDAPVSTEPSPALETALQGWLFFCEGALLRWLDQGGLERGELRVLLRTELDGALLAASAANAEPRAGAG